MIVEDHRDQQHGEDQAAGDAPPQLEPDRVERDLLAEPLSLPVAAEEIVRKDRQHRAEQHLKHGSAPSWRRRRPRISSARRRRRRPAWREARRGLRPLSSSGELESGNLLHAARNPLERRAEVGDLDERQDQADDPEDVQVGEQGDQAQDRHDLHLHFLGLVREVLGQRVQPEEEDAKRDDAERQEYAHHDHEHVRLTRRGDEHRQMFDGLRMKNGVSHVHLPCGHFGSSASSISRSASRARDGRQ